MKCAKCGTDYEGYDACPECAKDERTVAIASTVRNIILVVLALASMPVLLVMCGR